MPSKIEEMIPGFTSERIIALAQDVMKEISPLFKSGKNYGFFSIRAKNKELILPAVEIGNVPSENEKEIYSFFSEEKSERLLSHWEEGHITSYESRDPQNDKWGGAVLSLANLGFSFSGCREDEDEAFSTEMALRVDQMTSPYIGEIKRRTGNQYL